MLSGRQMIARLALAVVIVGLAWRIGRFALGFPLWGDEAFIVANLYSRDFAGMVSPLEYHQIAPLGFMWAELAVSRLLGMSEWALRTPAFLCGLFSLGLFWWFARRSLDQRSALLAVAIFAASYYVVRHSTEVKPYAGDLAVSLVLICLGWMVYRKSDSLGRWIAMILAGAAGVWLSYPAVFIGGAVAMLLSVLLWQRRSGKIFAGWLTYILVFAASFLAMYLIYAKPHAAAAARMTESHSWIQSFPPVSKPWQLPLWLLKVHTGNLLAYPIGGRNGGSTLTLLLVIVGSVSLWRGRRREFLLLLLGPLALMLAAAAMKKYPYGTSARVAQHMAPAFCLLAGVGLSSVLRYFLGRDRLKTGLCIVTVVLAGLAGMGLIIDIAQPQKKSSDQANRQVLRTLAGWTSLEDQWVIFNATKDSPYAPDIHQWGGSGARFWYYVRQFGPANVRWAPAIAEIPRMRGGRTWLIVYRDNKAPFPEKQLDQYLRGLRHRLGEAKQYRFKLTSPKDPPRSEDEAIEVYEFPTSRG